MVEQAPQRRGRGRPRKKEQSITVSPQIEQQMPVRVEVPLNEFSERELKYELNRLGSEISPADRVKFNKVIRFQAVEGEIEKRKKMDPPTFSPEVREALEEEGYSSFVLKGESLQSLINSVVQTRSGVAGIRMIFSGRYSHLYPFKIFDDYMTYFEYRKFDGKDPEWDKSTDKPRIVSKEPYIWEPLEAIRCEVAINLRQPFLPDSNNKDYFDQAAMVREFSKDLSSRIPGVEAIMGELPDYGELLLRHLVVKDDNFVHLLDSTQEYCSTRTRTAGIGRHALNISITNPRSLVFVEASGIDEKFDSKLWVTPLIIPAKTSRLGR